jgi:hypothetical protein
VADVGAAVEAELRGVGPWSGPAPGTVLVVAVEAAAVEAAEATPLRRRAPTRMVDPWT